MAQNSKIQLEILISTMYRSNLDFLKPMFKNCDISQLHLLIINQTNQDKILHSNTSNIRVINSFEKGLSKSRNLAIQNAVGDICLIADDDVVFEKDFHFIILDSYKQIKDANLITFKTKTFQNKPFSNYPSQIQQLKGFERKVLSVEISFKRMSLLNTNVLFDENFGLGATFQDSENFLLLRELLKIQSFKCYFFPRYIVKHEAASSSDKVDSDRFIFARSALNYKLYGNLAYAYVIKLILWLWLKGYIKTNLIRAKLKTALGGIKTYKKLQNDS